MTVRTATTSDASTIAQFNAAMAIETESMELDMDVVTAGVRAALSDSRAFYLLAESGGVPVGQLMVTYEWSDWRNGWIWWIQSVYVKPENRRQGVYRDLYARLTDMAESEGNVRGIRLYVMREKPRRQTHVRIPRHAPLRIRPVRNRAGPIIDPQTGNG